MKKLPPGRLRPYLLAIGMLAANSCGTPLLDTTPGPPQAPPGPIRIVPLGSTHEGHAVTRGHNRKFFRAGGWSYVVWIDQLGSLGDFRPQYRASRDLVDWSRQRPISDVRNGGASGIDFEVLPLAPSGEGRIAGLESHFDEALGRAWQFLRVYSAGEGTLTPIGPPVPVGAQGAAKAPSGYGSVARDDEGRLWVVERDERNVAGYGENALLLYHARPETGGNAGFVFDSHIVLPFESEAPARAGVTRAARVLCHRTWVVLVAYVEEPAGSARSQAALYVRAVDRTTGKWGKGVAIAAPGAIVPDAPRVAPDVRPSAWIGRDGRLFVTWMPASDTRAVVVSVLEPPYETAPAPVTALRVGEGRRPISAQIRLDSRFSPTRAYLFAIDGRQGATKPGEIAPGFLFSRFDGAGWEPPEPFGETGGSCLYLGMAQPELISDDDPLVALTQDSRGPDMQVRLIDASSRKYALNGGSSRSTP